jgi:hypothetical protein
VVADDGSSRPRRHTGGRYRCRRREGIEVAVVAGGKPVSAPHEAGIAADAFSGGFQVLITGQHGFQRIVAFGVDDDPTVIVERVRETMEE